MSKAAKKNVVEMKRSDAAAMIDRIRLALAGELEEDRVSGLSEELTRIFEEANVSVPKSCPGEAHRNAHIDNCGVCLHGLAWSWTGRPVKIR